MAKDRKPKPSPFEIDKKAIERLIKRVESINEVRTQSAVRKNVSEGVYVTIAKQRQAAINALESAFAFLKIGIALPDPIKTKDSPAPPDDRDE